jgi:hypothetical protein
MTSLFETRKRSSAFSLLGFSIYLKSPFSLREKVCVCILRYITKAQGGGVFGASLAFEQQCTTVNMLNRRDIQFSLMVVKLRQLYLFCFKL